MNISQSQSDALGGCQECRAASTPATESERNPVASVLVVDPKKPDWIGIELTGAQLQHVPAAPTGDRKVAGKQPSKRRGMNVQSVSRRSRGLVSPHRPNKAVRREDLPGSDCQRGEQGPRMLAPERHHPAMSDHIDGTK